MTVKSNASVLAGALALCSIASHSEASVSKRSVQQRGTVASLVAFNVIDDCRSWSMFVNLAEMSTKEEPGAPTTSNTVNLTLEQIDNCAQVRTDLTFQLDNGGKFQGGNLSSATININSSFPVMTCDANGCSEANAQVVAAFTWTGTGSTDRRTMDFTAHTAERMVHSRTTGSSRDATVIGSVSFNGLTFSPADADEQHAGLTGNAQSSLGIIHR